MDFKRKFEILKHCLTIAKALTKDEGLEHLVIKSEKVKDETVTVAEDVEEKEKDTKQITLEMYMDGLDIAQIAAKRGLVEGTVYGHLIHFVGTEIDAEDLIALDKLEKILGVLKSHEGKSSSEIKMILGEEYSYPEIKIGQTVLEIQSKNAETSPS